MNTTAAQMQKSSGRFSELSSRLFFVLGAFFVYRVGAHIPVPGVDPEALALMFKQQEGSILDMFNMFSGGGFKALEYFCFRNYALYFGFDYYPVNGGDHSCG